MGECPDLSVLEAGTGAEHVATCASCRVVVDLLAERRRGLAERDKKLECAKFEMLLAARDEGTIGASAGDLLDAHLRECADCRAVAATGAPSDRAAASGLPAVPTAAYALGREIGRGGMGRVLAAEDLRIGRPVAVKELMGKAPHLAARFEREARVTARLQHPGIVPIYEIGAWPDGTPFYAMRIVEGQTLGKAIASKQTLDERLSLLSAVIAAAEAVAFAHDKQVIHRDLTPNNVLVGAYGDTVVIDWGLAKDLATKEDDLGAGPYRDEPPAPELTDVGAVIGTAAYMPPEQAKGESVDERADVYALGAILYHLLAGAPPYRASKSDAILQQVLREIPRPLPTGAPRDLASIVAKAMSRDVEARYRNAGELAAELRRFQTGRLVEAHHYSRGERVRRWLRAHRVASAVALALVIAGSVGVTAVIQQRDRAEDQRAIAEQQRTRAEQVNATLLAEQGRQELIAGNTTRALAWLNEAYKAGDTSPEVRFMLASALRRVESVRRTFPCRVQSLAISKDGTLALGVCEWGTRVVRLADWSTVTELRGHFEGGTLSADNKLLATWNYNTLTIWDAATGAQRFSSREHTDGIVNVMITPDSSRIITTARDGTARIWSIAKAAVEHTLDARSGSMNLVRGRLTPDGNTLLTVTSDGVVTTWNIATAARIGVVTLPVQPLGEGTLSPDGTRYMTCHVDGSVRVTDIATRKPTMTFWAHGYASFGCEFSADGRRLLTTGVDGDARVWDATTGRLGATLRVGGVFTRGVFSPDGQRVATIGSAGVLQIWHAGTGTLLGSLDDPSGFSDHLVFTPDGNTLITMRDRAEVVVLDKLDGDFSAIALPPGMDAVATSPTGTQLALRAADGAISVFDTSTQRAVVTGGYREPVAWSLDGTRVALATPTGVVVLDGKTGHAIARITSTAAQTLALDEHGRRLLIANEASTVWNVDNGTLVLELHGSSDADSLSRAGDRVVSWNGREATIWNLHDHKQTKLALDSDVIGPVAFTCDGRHLLLARKDSATEVPLLPFATRVGSYDTQSGARVYELPAGLFAFLDAECKQVATSGLHSDIAVYDAATGGERVHVTLGPSMVVVGMMLHGGSLLAAVDGGWTFSLNRVADGRPLTSLQMNMRMAFTQDTFHMGGTFDTIDNEHAVLLLGPHPLIWRIALEQRSPAEVDRIVRDKVRWRVRDGRLVPALVTLHGRILHHGKPVAGAEVAVEHIGLASWPKVITDAHGRFELDRLPPSKLGVIAMGPDRSAKGIHQIELSGDMVTADFELDEEASITGIVVDEAGNPVAGVEVVSERGNPGALRGTSDHAGRFEIRALDARTYDIFVVVMRDGKPTGIDGAPGTARVEVKTNADHIEGVRLVVRRTPSR